LPGIRTNIIQALQIIVKTNKIDGISKEDSLLVESEAPLGTRHVEIINFILKSPSFKDLLASEGDDLCLPTGSEGCIYQFENVSRYLTEEPPTLRDVLVCRQKSTGIQEYHLPGEGGAQIRLVDVGGQKSERRKWASQFDSTDLIIFLVAINEYDMPLEEDSSETRLVDSLKLWMTLTQVPALSKIPFVVFFNKIDLFEEKIKRKPLSFYFSDWDRWLGSQPNAQSLNMYQLSILYLENHFRKRYGGNLPLQFYRICAMDTQACTKVWKSVSAAEMASVFAASNLY